MTLAELVIVLLILAILASVAVESLAPKVDQARYDATLKSLQQIRAAIISTDGSGASAAVAGFVADNGRWPVSLAELTATPGQLAAFGTGDLLPFGVQSAPAPHNDVLLPRGFRGPYLNLPPDKAILLDGWDNPFAVIATPTGGLQIISVAALRPPTTAGFAANLTIDIEPTAVQASMLAGKVTVSADAPPTHDVNVLLFTPAPAAVSATGVRSYVFALPAASFTATGPAPMPGEVATYEANYQIASGVADSQGTTVVLLAGPAAIRASTADHATRTTPTHLTLAPGTSRTIDFHLTLPATAPPSDLD